LLECKGFEAKARRLVRGFLPAFLMSTKRRAISHKKIKNTWLSCQLELF